MGENKYISAYKSFVVQQPSPENIDALEDCELLYFSLDGYTGVLQIAPGVINIWEKDLRHVIHDDNLSNHTPAYNVA